MDYKFLDKVVNQIVSETIMDEERVYVPFFPYYSLSSYRSPFTKHCKDVYGLNEQEIEYVWEEYREIIFIRTS